VDHYQNVPEATERAHMHEAMEIIQRMTGERPLGWYTGRDSPNTRRLVADYGGFEYDSDYYGDDLPFWMKVRKDRRQRGAAAHRALHAGLQRHALCAAPGLLARRPVLSVPERHLRRAVCRRRPRGDNAPKMMSIGMHCRLLGRPAASRRCSAFWTTSQRHDKVWVAAASTSPATGRSTPRPGFTRTKSAFSAYPISASSSLF
jgi:allantoinase